MTDELALRALKLLAEHELVDYVFVRTAADELFVAFNCSDVFCYASADAEEINDESDLALLLDVIAKVDVLNDYVHAGGHISIAYSSIRRKYRPLSFAQMPPEVQAIINEGIAAR